MYSRPTKATKKNKNKNKNKNLGQVAWECFATAEYRLHARDLRVHPLGQSEGFKLLKIDFDLLGAQYLLGTHHRFSTNYGHPADGKGLPFPLYFLVPSETSLPT
jgi:hypothetical protein